MELAANHIQSAYRGHRARREIASTGMETYTSDLRSDSEVNDENELQKSSSIQVSSSEFLDEELQEIEQGENEENENPVLAIAENETNISEDSQQNEAKQLSFADEVDNTTTKELNESPILEEVPVHEICTQMNSIEDEAVYATNEQLENVNQNEESKILDFVEDNFPQQNNIDIASSIEQAIPNTMPSEETENSQQDDQNGSDPDELLLDDDQNDNFTRAIEQAENENDVVTHVDKIDILEGDNLSKGEQTEEIQETHKEISKNETETDQDIIPQLDNIKIEAEVTTAVNEEQIDAVEEDCFHREEICEAIESKIENEEVAADQLDEGVNNTLESQLLDKHVVQDESFFFNEEDKAEDVVGDQGSSVGTTVGSLEATICDDEFIENTGFQEENIIQVSDHELLGCSDTENEIHEKETEANEPIQDGKLDSPPIVIDNEVNCDTIFEDIALQKMETDGIRPDINPPDNSDGLHFQTNEEDFVDPQISNVGQEVTEITERETIEIEVPEIKTVDDIIDKNLFYSEQGADTDLQQNDGSITSDQDYNAILDEVDQEVSNDDEEEIWRKLQKDIQLEEEQQQNLAAIRIQSSFRGYKTRRDLSQKLDNKSEEAQNADENDDQIKDIGENDAQEHISTADQETLETYLEDNENDGGVTEALAGLTESIASVALFMTDTTIQPNDIPSADTEISNDEDNNFLSQELLTSVNQNEVNDITEEPLSNGEAIDDVQLIKSYIIKTGISEDKYHPLETKIDENGQEKEADLGSPDQADASTKVGEQNNAPDPEGVFELYVESNETINDGLLDSSWQPQQENISILPFDVSGSDYTRSIGVDKYDDQQLLEEEIAAATKIQAGYRGHRERKRINDSMPHFSTENKLNIKSEFYEPIKTINTHEDMEYIEKENIAATKIQAGYRGNRDRKKAKDLKDNNNSSQCVGSAAVLEESFQQLRGDEIIEEIHLSSTERENYAATKIQAGYRGQRDRKRFNNLKENHDEHKSTKSNELILTEEISLINLKTIDDMKEKDRSLELEIDAATKIQAGYRGHRDRKRVNDLKCGNSQTKSIKNNYDIGFLEDGFNAEYDLDSIESRNAAATKIQAGYRGHRDRKRVNDDKRNKSTKKEIESDNNVTELKLDYLDKTINQSLHSLKHENAAATKIQAGYRGHRDRKRVNNLKEFESRKSIKINDELAEEESVKTLQEYQDAAATKIQAGYRGHRERKRLNDLNKPRSESILFDNEVEFEQDPGDTIAESLSLKLQSSAATKIQAGYRGNRDRKRFNELKSNKNGNNSVKSDNLELSDELAVINFDYSVEQDFKFEESQNIAATKIQASFRGHRDRKLVKELKNVNCENQSPKNESEPVENSFVFNLQEPNDIIGEISCEREISAATKIQAGYRGHRDRKRVNSMKDLNSDSKSIKREDEINLLAEDFLESRFEESHEDLNVLERENTAAAKIQAGYRGNRDRKRVRALKAPIPEFESTEINEKIYQQQEQIQEDIENKAAIAIQSGYRGYRTRKSMNT